MLDFATEATQGLSDLIWLALLHSTWIGLAIGSISAVAAWLIPPAAHRARHLMHLAALALLFGGSLVGGVVQTGFSRSETEPRVQGVPSAVERSPESITLRITPTEPAESPPPSPSPRGETHVDVGWIKARAASVVQALRPVAMAAWCLGAATFGLMLVLGSSSLRRIRRESTPAEVLDGRARTFSRLLRLRRVPEIRVHSGISEPCLAGLVRPVVLLPADWLATATVDEVNAVLAHELSHARRLDHLTYPALRFVQACLFFHPCVYWLSRNARREAEHAADILAARITGDPAALARALESVARLQTRRPTIHRLGLALGGERSSLLPRIQELLGMTPKRPRPIIWPLAAFPAAVVFAGIAATARPVPNLDGPSAFPSAASAPTPKRYFPRPKPPAAPVPLTREERKRLLWMDRQKITAEDQRRLDSLAKISFKLQTLNMTESAWRRLSKEGYHDLSTLQPGRAWRVDTTTLNTELSRLDSSELKRTPGTPNTQTYYEGVQGGIRLIHGGTSTASSWTACTNQSDFRLTVGLPFRDGTLVDALRTEYELKIELEQLVGAVALKVVLDVQPSVRTLITWKEEGQSSEMQETQLNNWIPLEVEGWVPAGSSVLLDTAVSVGAEPIDPKHLEDRLGDRRDYILITPTAAVESE
ncbi:M56 family metallopeptidase [Paludisphaera rhizosphaerae]|uniref:M56 family metallopeptidase n=1 Tax=Paludisphaera rhizosphaerae TaxID=2711216 RepID=UPI0013E9B7A2|nr:M56 family metallopeptidase [Paludisphaera rhizosphaerae]